MVKATSSKTVVCYGEILWDKLPGATRPGGAPMNVAYHLKRLQQEPLLISRVGNDRAGTRLLEQLKEWKLATTYIGIDSGYPTSEVRAEVKENHEVSYEIVFPVAWDFIPYQPILAEVVAKADALVFGSLSTRHGTSRETLFHLLEKASYNVFDVNLRPPFYDAASIRHLLLHTQLLKLNEHELQLVTDWYSQACTTEAERVKLLQEQFGINEILVTKGSRGASYFTPTDQQEGIAFPVAVADTIGSGDSFLAAFLAKRLLQTPAAEALSFAAALAAFVTQSQGACPTYTLQELEAFKAVKEKEINEKR